MMLIEFRRKKLGDLPEAAPSKYRLPRLAGKSRHAGLRYSGAAMTSPSVITSILSLFYATPRARHANVNEGDATHNLTGTPLQHARGRRSAGRRRHLCHGRVPPRSSAARRRHATLDEHIVRLSLK